MIDRLLPTVLAALMFLAPVHASASGDAPVSDWVTDGAAKVRLVAGAPAADGSLRAGLEIRLDSGWKTYWINPGPSGLPPRIDASSSPNLARLEARWPLPKRFEDGMSTSVGYSGALIVPLRIEAKDAAKPIPLRVKFAFGICEKICVPAEVTLSLRLVPGLEPDAFAAVQLAAFEDRVPQPARLNGEGPLSVVSAARSTEGLDVTVRFPDNAEIRDLFASAETTVGVPRRLENGDFRIKLKAGAPPREIRLLAVADNQAIEVPVVLDGLPAKP